MPVVVKFKSMCRWLLAFARRRSTYIIVASAALICGIALTATYATVVDYTDRLDFCAHTCHEMESTVYKEYTHSKHYRNRYGVVVKCSQCHVPHDNWALTLGRKALASLELYAHFTVFEGKGPEAITKAFEARRLSLAKRVWAGFAETNARECKACHKYSNMVLEDQRPSIRAQHTDAMKTDENCLDCHKGLTHKKMQEAPKPGAATDNFNLN